MEPVNIWPFIAQPLNALLPSDCDALVRVAGQFADLVSPVLADHLLAPVAVRLGGPLLDGFSINVPCPDHALILCVTNTAKDKFDVFSIRKVVDAILLLRDASSLDWDAITDLAREGGYYRPTRYFFALLQELGVPAGDMPEALAQLPGGPGRGAFRRVVEDFQSLFPYEQPLMALLWRELTICNEPAVALHNLGLRLRGHRRPGTGLPQGVSLPSECLPFANSSNART